VAVIALEGLLGRDPGNPIALAHLADVQIRRGRREEAAAALDRAESEAGTTAFTARLRGDIHYKAGHWEKAAQSYRDADALRDAKSGKEDVWPLVQLARCCLRSRDLEGAAGAGAAAVERDPQSAPAWVVLGDVAKAGGRLADAQGHYQRARDVAPADGWAHAKLVEVQLLQLPEDRREREIRVLMRTTGKENRHLAGVLARLRNESGDAEGAAAAWAGRARGGDLFARKQEGFALRRAGRLDDAAAVLGACLAEDPEDRYVFSSYVSLQHQRGALEELRRSLEDALPRAGSRRGAFFAALRKIPAPEATPEPPA
jgi:tetratricopeptide (TPR) repeat protein